jgi:hypothetical protein
MPFYILLQIYASSIFHTCVSYVYFSISFFFVSYVLLILSLKKFPSIFYLLYYMFRHNKNKMLLYQKNNKFEGCHLQSSQRELADKTKSIG